MRDTSNELVEQGKQRLDGAREWLLEEQSEQRVIERTAYSEFEMEMVDLPPEAAQNSLGDRWLQFFEHVRSRVPFNRRLRRISIAVAIVLLTVIFMLSSLPDVRDAIASFFVGSEQPTQTTNSSSSFIFSPGNVDSGEQVQAVVTVIPEGTIVASSSTNTTSVSKWPLPPAAMPTNCPAVHAVNNSHTVGTIPIWVTGFSGPRAIFTCPIRLHAAFRNGAGWAVHLVITMLAGYPDPVIDYWFRHFLRQVALFPG